MASHDIGEETIHAAASNSHTEYLALLLKYEGNVNKRDEKGRTPLFIACELNNIDAVKMILSHTNCKINEADLKGQTPLWIAARHNNAQVLKVLTKKETCLVNKSDNMNRIPLWIKCFHVCADAVEYLLISKRCMPNILTEGDYNVDHQTTPLMAACIEGHAHVVDLNMTNRKGQTPLHVSLTLDMDSISRAFLEQDILKSLLTLDEHEESPFSIVPSPLRIVQHSEK